MDAVKQIIENATDPLVVNIPEEYKNKKVEVIIRSLDEKKDERKSKYDFSKFIGKLEWKGDAVTEKRKLRDEWD